MDRGVLFPFMSPVRLRLAELRADRNMSKAGLAKASGVRRATIIELEKGRPTRVALDVLERLAKALEVEPGELLTTAKLPAGRKGK